MFNFLDPQVLPLLIPIVALVIPIVAIVGGLLYQSRREHLLHETIRLLAEKGQAIPPELLAQCGRGYGWHGGHLGGWRYGSPLRRGVRMLAVGVGLTLMFWVMRPESWLWAIGLIPIFVGLGHLLVWRLEPPPPQTPLPPQT